MTTTTTPGITPGATPGTTAGAGPGRTAIARYGDRWRSVPRELGFLVLAYPVALLGFIATVTAFTVGLGSLVTFVGIFVIIAALYLSRGFGMAELVRLEWAGRPRIERPEWQDARAKQGFWGWLRALFGNGHYWLYLLHTMVVNAIVALVSWTITVVVLALIVGGLLPWNFESEGESLVNVGDENSLAGWLLGLFGRYSAGNGPDALEVILSILLSLVLLAVLPFVTRGLVLMHDAIARGMLGAFRSDALQRTIIDLNTSRGAAQAAEGHSLRRLERDIHDGPQQRLVRLQMDLAAADRQLDADPDKARTLIAEATVQAQEALEELRSLSRGFAPPILMDRGLVAALESTASRSSIPIAISSTLPAGFELPQEIERNAYFVASEAITNATKHAGATGIDVVVGLRRALDSDDTWLDVSVTDNGAGGAVVVPGHGLAGIDERLRGLGGLLELTSPVGGPTVVLAHLPVAMSLGSSIR